VKVKINATEEQLVSICIPRSEAKRLSGSVQAATKDGNDQYAVPRLPEFVERGYTYGHSWYISAGHDNWVEELSESPVLDLTKPVQTRDGRPVEIKFVDERIGDEPVIGIIDNNRLGSWSKDGRWSIMDEHEDDLVNVPPPVAVVETVQVRDQVAANIYSDGSMRLENTETTGGFTLSADEMRNLIEQYEQNII
jgi:hypothetical protein